MELRIIAIACLFKFCFACGFISWPGKASASDITSSPRLFSTAKTRASLGPLAHTLPHWAGMDVLAIGPEDIDLAPLENNIGKVREAFHHFAEPFQDFPFSQVYRDWDVITITRQARAAAPHGYPVSARSFEERNVCVIILPDYDQNDPRKLASRIAGIPYRYLENLPGTASDWRKLILAHETQHCRHNGDKGETEIFSKEYEADLKGMETYRTYINDEALFHNMRDALISIRAVSAFLTNHTGHATSAALAPPHRQDKPAPDHYIAALKEARRTVRRGMPRLQSRPSALYRAVARSYEDGAFNSDLLAKHYAAQFLAGAQKYFPFYFGLRQEAR